MKTNDKKKKTSKADASGKTEWQTNDSDYTRLYRPKNLNEMVGQSMLKYTVRGWAKKKQVPGAILVHGQRGSGKTTVARIISATLNCKALTEDGDPCGECISCRALLTQNVAHPDYIEVNCADNTGVDYMRSLRERAQYKPRNNCLVIVLDEVHKLSPASQNLILKSVEEPRAHVRYILLTTEPQGIIDTLRSRLTKIRVSEVTTAENVKLLKHVAKKENIKLEDAMLEMICVKSDNIPRECLINLQAVASIIESGELDTKNITIDSIEGKLSALLGVPNYVHVQQFLVNIYAGKLFASLSALSGVTSKPMFLKSCIDTHSNMILAVSTKDPSKLISEKWVLGSINKMIAEGNVNRDQDTIKAFSGLMTDLVDAYTKMSQYQLGDSAALLTGISAKWCMKFKGE